MVRSATDLTTAAYAVAPMFASGTLKSIKKVQHVTMVQATTGAVVRCRRVVRLASHAKIPSWRTAEQLLAAQSVCSVGRQAFMCYISMQLGLVGLVRRFLAARSSRA